MKRLPVSVLIVFATGCMCVPPVRVALVDVEQRHKAIEERPRRDPSRRDDELALAQEILHATQDGDAVDRRELMNHAQKLLECLLLIPDERFVRALVLSSRLLCQQGRCDDAIRLYDRARPQVLAISAPGPGGPQHPPQLAVYKHLLGMELHNQAMRIRADEQRGDVLTLLTGVPDGRVRIAGAYQHLMYASLRHPDPATRKAALSQCKAIERHLRRRFRIHVRKEMPLP